MKKRFVAAFLIAAILVPTLSACECSSQAILSFDNGFSGKTEIAAGYSQKLVYKAEYRTDEEDYKISENFPQENILKLEYGEGVAEFNFSADVTLPSAIDSDLKDFAENQNALIYKLAYFFTIPLTITINGEEYLSEEKIESEAYFLPANLSFAPIYSKTQSAYYVIATSKTSAAASKLKILSETFYNQKTYTLRYNAEYLGVSGEDKDFGEDPTVIEEKYDFRKVITNEQLLFAVRGISVDENGSVVVPVQRFGDTNPLSFTKKQSAEITLPIKYDGGEIKDVKFTYDEISYRINETYSAGTAHKVYIQSAAGKSEDTDFVKNLALPVIFFQPMQSVSGEYDMYGCLKFTLTEIEIND